MRCESQPKPTPACLLNTIITLWLSWQRTEQSDHVINVSKGRYSSIAWIASSYASIDYTLRILTSHLCLHWLFCVDLVGLSLGHCLSFFLYLHYPYALIFVDRTRHFFSLSGFSRSNKCVLLVWTDVSIFWVKWLIVSPSVEWCLNFLSRMVNGVSICRMVYWFSKSNG